MRDVTFMGNSTAGPSIMHCHTKCLDFKCGRTERSPSEKLPFPMTDVPLRLSNMAAMKFASALSMSLDSESSGEFSISVIKATVHDAVVGFDEPGTCCAQWTSSIVRAL